jgi:hypothetical protein
MLDSTPGLPVRIECVIEFSRSLLLGGTMGQAVSDIGALQTWVDLHAIRNNLANHTRGIDRSNGPLLRGVYHPDAEVAYGFFDGPADQFCGVLTDSDGGPITMHRTSNIWVRFTGAERAVSESYAFVYSETPGEASTQALIGGRYLDRHERRDGVWKLNHRTYVLEWNVNLPGTGTMDANFVSALTSRGTKTPQDPGAVLLDGWEPGLTTGGSKMEIPEDLIVAAHAALAKQEIHDLVMAQARATDRRDEALLRSLWNEGATVDAGGFFTGTATEYCGFIVSATSELTRMYHSVANEWSKVDGDQAVAESYVIAFTTGPDGMDEFTGGRYLDRFERVGGVWKYNHRSYVMDWTMRQPTTDQSDEPGSMYESLRTRGSSFPDDPVYALWAS